MCIWRFNGCVENKFYPEPTCYACFDECKMIAMGMADPMQCQCLGGGGGATERPITDIDIPEEQVTPPPQPPSVHVKMNRTGYALFTTITAQKHF